LSVCASFTFAIPKKLWLPANSVGAITPPAAADGQASKTGMEIVSLTFRG
jgi:hypothetical protein